MRFKVTGDHRKVLEKQKFIEFEDVFSLEEIEKVASHVDAVLAKRTKRLIESQSCSELFHAGRDVWRDDPVLQQFICNRGLAQLTAQLFQQNTLCLGFDQALRTTTRPGFPNQVPASLQQKSCIQPLAGVVLIRLLGDWGDTDPLSLYSNNLKNREFDKKGPQNFYSERATIAERQGASENKNSEANLTQSKTDSSSCLSILPKKRENAVLIAPSLIVPWEMFFQEPKRSFLMLGYAPAKALYVSEKNDLNLHFLKKLGYVFGDHLNTNFHPLLYK
ncbi:MAG TPA: hypothetical protein VFU89_02185 [Rhabdochlamydiaceae bacterium]|nr:hypothetical protein [Rhabdochlamydiaceae bacterium]